MNIVFQAPYCKYRICNIAVRPIACLAVFILTCSTTFGIDPAQEDTHSQERQAILVSQLNAGNEEQRMEALTRLGTILASSPESATQQTLSALENVLMRDSSPVNRALAARAFEFFLDERTISLLLASLKTERETAVRKAIIYALSHQRSARITSELIPLLKDKNSEVRAAAAFTLAEIGDAAAADAFFELLSNRGKDEDAFARTQAVRAFGKMSGQNVIYALINSLARDKSSEVRREAAKALGSVSSKQDTKVVEALHNAMLQGDPYLVRAAEAAIAKINSRNP